MTCEHCDDNQIPQEQEPVLPDPRPDEGPHRVAWYMEICTDTTGKWVGYTELHPSSASAEQAAQRIITQWEAVEESVCIVIRPGIVRGES